MSCQENCLSCNKAQYYSKNFPPGTEIIVDSNYCFPRDFPVSRRKKIKIETYVEEDDCFLILATSSEGGRHISVDGKSYFGFLIPQANVARKKPIFLPGDTVRIVDPDNDYYWNSDPKKTDIFPVLGFNLDPDSDEFGNYFLHMPSEDEVFEGKNGAWVHPSYLSAVVLNEKKQMENQSEKINQSMTSLSPQSFDMLLKRATTRSVSRTAIQTVRKGLLRIIRRHYDSQLNDQNIISNNISILESLLDSPLGQGALGVLTGFLLKNIPKLNEKEEVQAVAEEIIIEGMSVGMDQALNFALENIVPELIPMLDSIPGTEEIKKMIPVSLSSKEPTEEKPKQKISSRKKTTSKKEKELSEKEEIVIDSSGNQTSKSKK